MSTPSSALLPSMHRALAIPELRGLIASSVTDKHDLFQLVQTTKDLHEPALDSLWRDLSSLLPLLARLPRHAVRIDHDDKVRLLKLVEPDDWARLDTFARRVRALDMDHIIDRLRISLNGAKLLHDSHRRRSEYPLLPNLERLGLAMCDAADIEILRLLLGPRVRTLTINWRWDDTNPQDVLDALRMLDHSITTLNLHFNKGAGVVNSAAIVQYMPDLTTVVVRGSHGSVSRLIQTLASASSLVSLTIKGPAEVDLAPDTSVEDTQDAFKFLESFEGPYDAIPHLLRPPMTANALQVLTIAVQLPRDHLANALATAFHLIGTSCHRLTTLTMNIHAHEDQRDPRTLLKPPKHSSTNPMSISLEPLFPLHQLERLFIHDFSNTMVPSWHVESGPRIAPSWPCLFHLSWHSQVAATPATFETLSAFADCHSLGCLSLPLDATVKVDGLPRFKNCLMLGVSDWLVTADVVKQVAASVIQLREDKYGRHQIHWSLESAHDIWQDVHWELQRSQQSEEFLLSEWLN